MLDCLTDMLPFDLFILDDVEDVNRERDVIKHFTDYYSRNVVIFRKNGKDCDI